MLFRQISDCQRDDMYPSSHPQMTDILYSDSSGDVFKFQVCIIHLSYLYTIETTNSGIARYLPMQRKIHYSISKSDIDSHFSSSYGRVLVSSKLPTKRARQTSYVTSNSTPFPPT